MPDISSALSAYKAAATRIVEQGNSLNTAGKSAEGSAFSQLLQSTVDETINASKKSEMISMQAISGNADMKDVVLAISNAETALNTMVAVRDKVLSAYQQIMQMNI